MTCREAYYLLHTIGISEAQVPHQIFVATLVQSCALVIASLVAGRLSDRTGRRKIMVLGASVVYGVAMFAIAIAIADSVDGFLVGMALGGLGFGGYMAVDLALVADVLPDQDHVAKDSRGVQHRRRPSVRRRARDRSGRPRPGGRQLRRALLGRGSQRGRRSLRHPAGQGRPVSPGAAGQS